LSSDALGANGHAISIQDLDKCFEVSFSNIEESLVIHELRTTDDLEDNPLLFRTELISRTKEQRHSGIDESARCLLGLHGVNGGMREHQVEQASDAPDRIIDRHS
jgi:hypothetical protein